MLARLFAGALADGSPAGEAWGSPAAADFDRAPGLGAGPDLEPEAGRAVGTAASFRALATSALPDPVPLAWVAPVSVVLASVVLASVALAAPATGSTASPLRASARPILAVTAAAIRDRAGTALTAPAAGARPTPASASACTSAFTAAIGRPACSQAARTWPGSSCR